MPAHGGVIGQAGRGEAHSLPRVGSRRLIAYRCSFEGLTVDAYGLAEKELALGRRDTDSAPTIVPRNGRSCRAWHARAAKSEMHWRKPTLEPCSTVYETFGGYSTLISPYRKE